MSSNTRCIQPTPKTIPWGYVRKILFAEEEAKKVAWTNYTPVADIVKESSKIQPQQKKKDIQAVKSDEAAKQASAPVAQPKQVKPVQIQPSKQISRKQIQGQKTQQPKPSIIKPVKAQKQLVVQKVQEQRPPKTLQIKPKNTDEIQPTKTIIKKEEVQPKNIEIQPTNNITQKKIYLLKPIFQCIFVPQSSKVLEGKNSKQIKKGHEGPYYHESDCFHNLGIISLFYQNDSYTDGRYNCNNYTVQKGKLLGQEAYRVHPPEKLYTQFLASQHCLAFKIIQNVPHSIYKVSRKQLVLFQEIQADKTSRQGFCLVKVATISTLQQPTTFICVKKNLRLSQLHELSQQAQGAIVFKDNKIQVEMVSFILPEPPKHPDLFPYGPGAHQNRYNPNRDIFRIFKDNKQVIVWENLSKNAVFITQIDVFTYMTRSLPLASKTGYTLAAATGDETYVYHILAQCGEEFVDKTSHRVLWLIKSRRDTGLQMLRKQMPTEKSKLNIHSFEACQIQIIGSDIGLVVSRKMTQGDDKLNHQGACAAVFDAQTLELKTLHGQTSGHSFAHSLIARQDKKFSGIDLGDNYPRAVHHWNFDAKKIQFKEVYAFKTQHGKQPKNPAGVAYPLYKEISTPTQSFYQWSNDNKTYTELGAPGILEHPTGTLIFFAGENKPKPLESRCVGQYVNSSRNIGFVKVSKNLDDKNSILSDGPEERGGFYTFSGKWSIQTNKGVKWLTDLKQGWSVSRLKTAIVDEKRILLLFQCWSKDRYISTQYLICDSEGRVLSANRVIDFPLRLHKSDDVCAESGCVVCYTGDKNKNLRRYAIRLF